MVIDAHGHYTTVPAGLRVFRALQISNMGRPTKAVVNISDEEIRTSLEKGQIRLLDERGIDVMLFSPMASAMGHHRRQRAQGLIRECKPRCGSDS